MRVIKPTPVTPAVLLDSSVPEDEPAWDAGETYAEGDVVRVEHALFKSVEDDNTGNDPSDPDGTAWAPAGPTNRWRMFDAVIGSQTEAEDEIVVELCPSGIVDSVALLNISASTVRIVFEADEEVVFDQTYALVDNSEVVDWYSYFFAEIRRKVDLHVTGVSLYANPKITVTLEEPGAVVRCGACVIGQSKYIGLTEDRPNLGINDFSRKGQTEFGSAELVRRSFSRIADYTVLVESVRWDAIYALLGDLRATPCVWIPSDTFGSTTIFGWYRDFTGTPSLSFTFLSLRLEGLT